MADIRFDVTGDRQVGLRFDAFPDGLYQDLLDEITKDTRQLFAAIQALTPRRTGKLAGEERMRVFQSKDRITGQIDIDAPKGSEEFAKAGALEYGAHRARGLLKTHPMKLDHFWSNKLDAPITVMVEAHARPPNVAEVAFERGPLAAMGPEIAARLNAVVEKRVLETNS